MNLRDLELYCDVVSFGSFSKAAKARGISQPAASEIIKGLEEHLGVELLNRTVRPLESTQKGRLFYKGCRQLLDDFRRLEDSMLHSEDFQTHEQTSFDNRHRLRLTISLGEFSLQDEIASEVAALYQALTAAHITGGGEGLVLDDWQMFVEEGVPVSGGLL